MATINTYTVGINVARDYTTLSAWYAARAGDLVTDDYIEVAECYNDGDMDDSVDIDSSTTDEDHYFKIYTPVAERHTGEWNTGFQLVYDGSFNEIMYIHDEYVWVEGIGFSTGNHATGGTLRAVRTYNISADNEFKFSHNIVWGENTGSSCGVHLDDADCNALIWNNIIYDTDATNRGGIYIDNADEVYCYNNTVYDCKYGIEIGTATKVVAKNNAFFDNGTSDFHGTYHADSDYNCSSDTTAPGDHSLHSKTAANNFTDAANGDFTVKNTSADLYWAGVDCSADSDLSFADDVIGSLRTHWDIGAFGHLIGAGVSSEAQDLAKKLYSVWRSGVVNVAAECEIVDIMSSIGDKPTINTGNPQIQFSNLRVTGVDVTVGDVNRVVMRCIGGGWLEDEDNVFSSSSSSVSSNSSSSVSVV